MAQEPSQISHDSAQHAQPTPPRVPSPETAEIRSQIEQTRAEMSQTIDAIQARLSPSRLMSNATQNVKNATVGRVKRLASRSNGYRGSGTGGFFETGRVMRAVTTDLLPVALIGIATAVLIGRAVKQSRNGRRVGAK